MTKKSDAGAEFARRMRRMRTSKGLTLEELGRMTGYDARYLEKLENFDEVPPVAAIIQVSRALTLDPGRFLDAKGGKRDAGFEKRAGNYAYRVLTPDAAHKRMKAFLVTIEPKSEHRGAQYRHEGEEFIYVLAGKLELRVGKKKYSLACGGSIHFDSSQVHRLKNPGGAKTELVVVIYTP
ncbi:MAG: cupin domain-containing protein [bacterium]